jgi:hypothetical protein
LLSYDILKINLLLNLHLKQLLVEAGTVSAGYLASTGRFDYRQVDKAIREFKNRVGSGRGNVRLLVARHIQVYKWTKSSLRYERRQVYFEVEFNGEKINKRTVGDLYITKARDGIQALAMSRLNDQSLSFMMQNRRFFTTYTGGDILSGIGRIREVDSYLGLNQTVIGIFEADCKSRDLPAAHAYCLEHFVAQPNLRSVLLLKIFLRGRDYARMAVVAVLYLRRASGPTVADAVAFGTRPLDAADAVPGPVARVLRSLPPIQPGPRGPGLRQCANPWTAAQQPHITVPAADLFGRGGAGGAPGGAAAAPRAARRKGSADRPTDFVVDLWPIFMEVNNLAHLEDEPL